MPRNLKNMIHFHNLKVTEIRRETDDTVSIAFGIPEEEKALFAYDPGQYLTIRTDINGEEVRRSYSLCSAPSEGVWRVAVKKVDGGRFSTWANETLQSGTTLEVMPPQGRFVVKIRPDATNHYVLYAAGSGITPILSIIKEVLSAEPGSRITLFYGNRNKRSIIFLEELETLKNLYMDRLSLHFIFSREMQASPLFEGRITGERCRELIHAFVPDHQDSHHYVCGPEEMINDTILTLKTLGVPESRIHFELFSTPVGSIEMGDTTERTVTPAPAENGVATVQIKLDGRSFDFELPYNGQNILDAGMVTGADLPFSCKGGVCCTCRAKLVEGEVHMDANYALEQWELDEGFILTCQSHPRSSKLIVDFDQQ